jgi:hypothetical protein
MKKTVWAIVGAFVAVAVLITGVLVIRSGLSTPTTQEGSDSHHHGDPLAPQDATPSEVARNALSVIFAWQPAQDASPWDALHRAEDLVTGPLEEAAATSPTPAPAPPSEWAAWKRGGDTLTAAVTVTEDPVISGTIATTTAQLKQVVLHADGDSTPYMTMTATVTLAQDSDGVWRVSNYQLRANR